CVAGEHVRRGGELERHAGGGDGGFGGEVRDGAGPAGRSVVELGEPDGGDAQHHQRDADERCGGDAGDDRGLGVRGDAGRRECVAGEHVRRGGELERHAGGGDGGFGGEVRDGAGPAGRSVVELGEPDGGDAQHHKRDADERCGGDAGDDRGLGVRGDAWRRECVAGEHVRRGGKLERHAGGGVGGFGGEVRDGAGPAGRSVVELGDADGGGGEHDRSDVADGCGGEAG